LLFPLSERGCGCFYALRPSRSSFAFESRGGCSRGPLPIYSVLLTHDSECKLLALRFRLTAWPARRRGAHSTGRSSRPQDDLSYSAYEPVQDTYVLCVLQHRVYQLKTKQFPGFTSKYNVNRLVYFEAFEYVGNAIAREKEMKSWTRAKRVALIESKNPKWDDLTREWGKPQTFRFMPASAWIPRCARDGKS
jgi:putative endonuclease